jgi:TonB family protein
MRALTALCAIALATPAALAKSPEPLRPQVYHVDTDVEAYTPTLTYPVAARQQHVQGSGFYLLFVQIRNGVVREVKIDRSTGSKILDDAAVHNLKGWLFKPPLLRLLEKRHGPSDHPGELVFGIPITFRL